MNDHEALIQFYQELQPKAEPIIADRSAVEQYATCPFQGYIRRTQQIDDHSIAQEVGQAIHAVAEDVLKEAVKNNMPGDEAAEEIVDRLPTVRPDIQMQVVKAAKYFADLVCDLRIHDIIGVEMQIDDACKTRITDLRGNPFKLTTCLDLLSKGREKSLHVIDWKGGYKKRTNAEAYESFQGQFIANILFKMFDGSSGDRIETIHFWYYETYWGSKSYARFDREAEIPSLPHLTLERQIEGRIFQTVKLWATDCRDAWPEMKKCSWCPIQVVKQCPHAIPAVKDLVNDPKGAVDQLVVLKQVYDNAAKAAKEYVRKNGPIKGTEAVFEWRPSRKFSPKLYKSSGNGEKEDDEE